MESSPRILSTPLKKPVFTFLMASNKAVGPALNCFKKMLIAKLRLLSKRLTVTDARDAGADFGRDPLLAKPTDGF